MGAPLSGGTPGGCPLLGGTPGRHPLPRGYPGQAPPAGGVPQVGTPLPGPRMGYPPPGPGMEYPPFLDLGWGTPPPHQLDGVTLPPRCELTHRLKTLPSLVLRTRSVTITLVLTSFTFTLDNTIHQDVFFLAVRETRPCVVLPAGMM